jgi:RNA polymerase sigma-70 factor (ECF subfamily)
MNEPAPPSGQTTALLLNRLRGGDRTAADLLVRRVEPMLKRWAHGRLPPQLRDANDTADLVQLALMRALARSDQFDAAHAGAFYAYLRQTLMNALRDALRERRLQPERADEAALASLPAAAGSLLEATLGREGAIAYEQALQQLPPHYQALIVMRFEFGMSFPEIGEELSESADGVRIKLQRALRKMSELLHEPDGH